MCHTAKAGLRENCTTLNVYIREKRKFQFNNLYSHLIFYEVTVTLIPNPDKDNKKKEKKTTVHYISWI